MHAGRKERIYIDLDSLLDTRLSTIASIDPELAEELSVSESYKKRTSDTFGKIPNDVFKEAYSNRDEVILSNSMMTNIMTVVAGFVTELSKQAVTQPFHDGVVVEVNTYPYTLDDEEREELAFVLDKWLFGLADIDIVRRPIEELLPSYCKFNYCMMVMYDHETWMNMHADKFMCKGGSYLSDMFLFAPALYAVQPSAEEDAEISALFESTFQGFEMLASPLVKLQLIDVKYFSIIEPKDFI